MVINAYCTACLRDKWLNSIPAQAAPAARAAFRQRVLAIVDEAVRMSSPEKDYLLNEAYADAFGPKQDYTAIKRHFNALMLELEPAMLRGIDGADDPLRRAIQYAMTGNFIDFAAMDSVDEATLARLIDESDRIEIDDGLLDGFRAELSRARRLTCIADNCGELVMDKVLMKTIGQLNPALEITAVVKGGPIVNDATREDSGQVRLDEAAHHIVDTGCPIAGVPEGRISEACRRALYDADVLISKGQANYETLCGCGLNLYYIFMCKCRLFTDRFSVPLYSGIITRERENR